MSLLALALVLFLAAAAVAGWCLLSMLYRSPWRAHPHLNPTPSEQTLACVVAGLVVAGLVLGAVGMI